MSIDSYKSQTTEALKMTKEGLDLLLELYELQEAIKLIPVNETFEQILKEIIEKEKQVVLLLQNSNQIQRVLIKIQHDRIEKLVNKLP